VTRAPAAPAAAPASEKPPPFPSTIKIAQTAPHPKGDYEFLYVYPADARKHHIQGNIRVRLVVDETGRVRSPVLLNRLGYGLDELALARAAQIEFEPATDLDGQPVTTIVVWTFVFTLPPPDG